MSVVKIKSLLYVCCMQWNTLLQAWQQFWNEKKNLFSVIIILTGLFLGSLFVDLGQLMTGRGFSGTAIRSHEVLETGGKTWVGYTEPKVHVKVISDEACVACDPSEALLWLRRIVPTLEAERIDISTEVGQSIAASERLVTLPAFIFSETVTQTEFYTQAEPLFRPVSGGLAFDMNKIGMPIGRYLITPAMSEGDIVLGLQEAPVTLMIFSDFQCQYCKDFHTTYKRLLTEYGEKLKLVWKHFPLPTHPAALGAAKAAHCAAAQGQFMSYADLLFERQGEWGKAGGERRFKDYARRVRGLNARIFDTCLNDPVTETKVMTDISLASDFFIESAPTSFVNHTFVSGAAPYEDLKAIIETELAK